jgi:hypothetical protein
VLFVPLLLLASCGGDGQVADPAETASARGEPVRAAEGTTPGPGQAGRQQNDPASYEDFCIEKQFAEATRYMSSQETTDYETQIVDEAVARGLDPQAVLAERGFYC